MKVIRFINHAGAIRHVFHPKVTRYINVSTIAREIPFAISDLGFEFVSGDPFKFVSGDDFELTGG